MSERQPNPPAEGEWVEDDSELTGRRYSVSPIEDAGDRSHLDRADEPGSRIVNEDKAQQMAEAADRQMKHALQAKEAGDSAGEKHYRAVAGGDATDAAANYDWEHGNDGPTAQKDDKA